MENVEVKNSKGGGPHSFSTPPFSRTNLSSSASTSLLHRPRIASTLRSVTGGSNMPNLGPVNISSVNSRKKGLPSSPVGTSPSSTSSSVSTSSFDFNESKKTQKNSSNPIGSPSESLLNAVKGQSTGDKWETKSSTEESTSYLPAAVIKDEKQAKKNDMILQERLMEAKSINPKSTSGATVHKFSLWSGVKNQAVDNAPPTIEIPTNPTVSVVPPSVDLPKSTSSREENISSNLSSGPSNSDGQVFKPSKQRGPKVAIEKVNQDLNLVSAKLAHLEVSRSHSEQVNSKNSTPQRSLSNERAMDMTPDASGSSNRGTVSAEKSSRGSFGMTSSLRFKVDSAARASHSMNDDLGVTHSKEGNNLSKKLFASHDRSKEEENNINRNDDICDGFITPGSIEEEEDRVILRPTPDPNDDKSSAIGRPPLPGIKHQNSSSDAHPPKPKSKHRVGGQSLGDGKVPSINMAQNHHPYRSASHSSPPSSVFESELDLSPMNQGKIHKISPPALTKTKSINRGESNSTSSSSREFSSAPGSPLSSPRLSDPSFINTPKIAFRSRPPSVTDSASTSGNNSLNNSYQASTNSSMNTSLPRASKEESSRFAFLPIRDAAPSAPESRSHSIVFNNPREFTSNLSLNLQTINGIDDAAHEGSNRASRSGSIHIVNEGYNIQDSSPDYSRDPFDSPSPTLSVMSHISEHDLVDRYEQLVYAKVDEPSPRDNEDKTQPVHSNPFANHSNGFNPFASKIAPGGMNGGLSGASTAVNTANINYPRANVGVQMQNNHTKDLHLYEQEVSLKSTSFNEDDRSGYSEIVYTNGSEGEHTLRWKKGTPIGEGTFGRVYKGMNEKTGELAAVKQLGLGNGSEAEIEGISREIRVMWQLDNENIVR